MKRKVFRINGKFLVHFYKFFVFLKARHPQLLYESKVYKILQGGVGIPHIRWYVSYRHVGEIHYSWNLNLKTIKVDVSLRSLIYFLIKSL